TLLCPLPSHSSLLSTATLTPDIYTLSLHDALPILNEKRVFSDTPLKPSEQPAPAPAPEPEAKTIAFDRPAVLDEAYAARKAAQRSEEHTSELQSRFDLVCRLLLEKKKH